MVERCLGRAHRGEYGFTLIEMSIALIVLMIGVVSIAGISAYVSRANGTSNTLNVLATAAQDEVDRLRAARWDRRTEDPKLSVGGSLTDDVANHFRRPTDTPAGELIIRWEVSDGPGTTGDLRTVTIKVVQVNPPVHLRDGFTVTTILNRS